ncbi:heat shock 70 kDa protein 12B-like isoform X2 [Dreissena polymorpha]|nr:heat shock 70 kDa protein 12B-like isoform X2 [Dreissena polymorpha]
MMWPVLFGFVTFLSLECTAVIGNMQVARKKEITIECASNTDLTFKFYSNLLKKFLTIAECDINRQSCALLTTTHTNVYTILYTGRGGILVLTDLEEEIIGNYQCYETVNPQNSVSTNITTSEYTATQGNNYTVPTKSDEPLRPQKRGHIVLGVFKDTFIECSSNVDITFKLINHKANVTVTLAECDLTKKACTILQPNLHNKYNLSYTGIGGVLHIKSLNNESFGTYICCETYNPDIFVSIDVIARSTDAANNTFNFTILAENTTDIHSDQGATNSSSFILAIVLPSIAALTTGIVFINVYLKKKAFIWAASNATDDLDMSPTTPTIAKDGNEEDEKTRLLGLTSSTSNCDSTHHDDFGKLHIESPPSIQAVAALELGTTHSGYAFSFTHDPNNVVINKNWLYGGSSTEVATKTPTIVLLDNKGAFHSFGFDAEKQYDFLANENTHQGWRLFRRFKMELYKNCSLDTTIDDLEGNPYPAMEIFTMTLHFLKEHLLIALKHASPELLETSIQFIITVPAIWTSEAKLFIRESAVKAGIKNQRLKLVVDSVAAATWLTRLNIKDSPEIELQTPGSKWLVVKIGGGTADVLAYEVLSEGKVNVILASGGAWGFTNVEKKILENLDRELGAGNLDKLRRERIGDYYELLQEISDKTRSKYIFSQNVCFVRLPNSLSQYAKHRIETTKIKAWFESEISSFIAHIKTVLNNNPSLKEVTNMVLVDQFAESMNVQTMLREEFPELKVIIPPDSKLAVLKGAVLYGHITDTDTSIPSDSI